MGVLLALFTWPFFFNNHDGVGLVCIVLGFLVPSMMVWHLWAKWISLPFLSCQKQFLGAHVPSCTFTEGCLFSPRDGT